jgi:hypothetical protein
MEMAALAGIDTTCQQEIWVKIQLNSRCDKMQANRAQEGGRAAPGMKTIGTSRRTPPLSPHGLIFGEEWK